MTSMRASGSDPPVLRSQWRIRVQYPGELGAFHIGGGYRLGLDVPDADNGLVTWIGSGFFCD